MTPEEARKRDEAVRSIFKAQPGEPACELCGCFLLFSARQRGSRLCGPCRREVEEADNAILWAMGIATAVLLITVIAAAMHHVLGFPR
jgi:hypothetical protein